MIKVLGENLYTTADVAEMLNTTTVTIASYIKAGRLKAVVIGGKKYINEASLKTFINPE